MHRILCCVLLSTIKSFIIREIQNGGQRSLVVALYVGYGDCCNGKQSGS